MPSKENGLIIILFAKKIVLEVLEGWFCVIHIYRTSCTNTIWLLTYLSDALLLKDRHPFTWDIKIVINAATTPKDTLLQSHKEYTF